MAWERSAALLALLTETSAMTEQRDRDRAETPRRQDDRDLIEGVEPAPSQGGRSGSTLAADVGSQDEARQDIEAAGVTRVRKREKLQPNIPTRPITTAAAAASARAGRPD